MPTLVLTDGIIAAATTATNATNALHRSRPYWAAMPSNRCQGQRALQEASVPAGPETAAAPTATPALPGTPQKRPAVPRSSAFREIPL